jgi:hypothetical protein
VVRVHYESRIEIWKSKPAWRAKSARERERILGACAQVIQARAEKITLSDGALCLIEKADASLLIWETSLQGSGVASKVSADIAEYFEPLLFVKPDGTLSLKTLVEKLARGNDAPADESARAC